MGRALDVEKIAAGLGVKPAGRVRAGSGYFGAMQLAAEVQARLRTPAGGGRATDPEWTERRQVAMRPATLRLLETFAKRFGKLGVRLEPLQLAAVLLEREASRLQEEESELAAVEATLVERKRRAEEPVPPHQP